MTSHADYIIVCLAVLSVPFLFGMGIGKDRALQQIATVCEPQPGEGKLLASRQDKNGVTCMFAPGNPAYGRAVRVRKATRS